MRVKTVEIENFLSIGNVTVDFQNLGVIHVDGENRDEDASESNGAGKSSLFTEPLLWALYGVTSRGVKGDDVVNRSAKKGAFVAVEFEANGCDYRVERYRRHPKGKNGLTVLRDGRDISKATVRATDKLVARIVGADLQTFSYSIVLGQGMARRFSQLTDSSRKEVLEGIVGVGVFDDARVRCRDNLKEFEEDLGSIRDKEESVAARVADLMESRERRQRLLREQIEESIAHEDREIRDAKRDLGLACEDERVTGDEYGLASKLFEESKAKVIALRHAADEELQRTKKVTNLRVQGERLLTRGSSHSTRVEEAVARAQAEADRHSNAAHQLNELKASLQLAVDAHRRTAVLVDDASAASTSAADVVSSLRAEKATAQANHTNVLNAWEVMHQDHCPTCRRPIDGNVEEVLRNAGLDPRKSKAALDDVVDRLRAAEETLAGANVVKKQAEIDHQRADAYVREHKSKIDMFAKEVARLESTVQHTKKVVKTIEDEAVGYGTLVEEWISEASEFVERGELGSMVADLDKVQHHSVKSELQAAEAELEDRSTRASTLQSKLYTCVHNTKLLTGRIDTAQSKKTKLLDRLGEVESGDDPDLEKIEAGERKLAELKSDRRSLKSSVAELRDTLHVLNRMRSLALDEALSFLNARIAFYSKVMTDGHITAVLSATSESKTGSVVDRIDLTISTDGGSYSSASGGEQDRIDLCIALAIHDLVTEAHGSKHNLLVLDEPANFIDPHGLRSVVDLLHSKLSSGALETVIVISQNPAFRELLDPTWTVVKEGGRSRLEVG